MRIYREDRGADVCELKVSRKWIREVDDGVYEWMTMREEVRGRVRINARQCASINLQEDAPRRHYYNI